MFIFDNYKKYGMPPFFGGSDYDPDAVAMVNDATLVNFTQRTDAARLEEYLPQGFSLLRPEITIGFAQFREVQFLGGSAYNAVQVTVPVSFCGRRDYLQGDLNLVIWENKTIPILGGREDSGMPKIPADIEDLHIFQSKYFSVLSFEGNTFLRLEMNDPQPVYGSQFEQIQNQFSTINALGWRYIPRIGMPGADLSQPTLYPQFFETESAWMGTGCVQWTKQSYEMNERENVIINALADLPVSDIGPVIMCKGRMIFRPAMGRVLM